MSGMSEAAYLVDIVFGYLFLGYFHAFMALVLVNHDCNLYSATSEKLISGVLVISLDYRPRN